MVGWPGVEVHRVLDTTWKPHGGAIAVRAEKAVTFGGTAASAGRPVAAGNLGCSADEA